MKKLTKLVKSQSSYDGCCHLTIFFKETEYNNCGDIYSRVQKSIENFIFRPKMAIFRRAGIKEGGLPLQLAFQYLILVI